MNKISLTAILGLLALIWGCRPAIADKFAICRSIKNRIGYEAKDGQTLSSFITSGQISPYQAASNLILAIKILGKDSNVMLQEKLASIDSSELALASNKRLPDWFFQAMKARGFQGEEPALRGALIEYRNRLFVDLAKRDGDPSLVNGVEPDNLEQHLFKSELDFVKIAVAISTSLGIADIGCEKALIYMFCR